MRYVTPILLFAVLLPSCGHSDGGDYIVNTGISGAGANDIYMCGYKNLMETGFIKKYQKGSWTTVFEKEGNSFWGIDTLAAENIIAVGSGFSEEYGSDCGFIAHYKSGEWNSESFLVDSLYGVSAISTESALAVGDDAVLVYDGEIWGQVEIPDEIYETAGQKYMRLKGVWGDKDENAYYIVGEKGVTLRYHDEKLELMQSNTKFDLSDIWGVSKDKIYAVGGSDSSKDRQYVVLEYNGEKWRTILSGDDTTLIGIYAKDGVVYAVGGSRENDTTGILIKFEYPMFRELKEYKECYLWDVFAIDDSLYLAGTDDNIFIEPL